MDLREIQALHAQYSTQPVVIDVASHKAAMPLLPASEPGAGMRRRHTLRLNGVSTTLRKFVRPTLLGLAIAALAGGGGMSAARMWHALHNSAVPTIQHTALATQVVAPSSPTPAAADAPINAAPARPLSASDFGQQPAAPALARIDPRSLAIDAANVASPSDRRGDATANAVAQAAASSIRAQHSVLAAQPVVVRPETPTAQPAAPAPPASDRPVTPAPSASASAAPAAAQPVPAPVSERSAIRADAQVSKPALRPIRHLATRRTGAGTESSTTTATHAQPSTSSAPTAKGSDVQLF